MCIIMLRGRHRGLPLKVDRAIMLPKELGHSKRAHLRRLRASRVGGLYGTGMIGANSCLNSRTCVACSGVLKRASRQEESKVDLEKGVASDGSEGTCGKAVEVGR